MALLFWAIAFSLFALPFFGEADAPDWGKSDPRRSDADLPFAEDLAYFDSGEGDAEFSGYGADLAGDVGEALIGFLDSLGVATTGLDAGNLEGIITALEGADLLDGRDISVPEGRFGAQSVLSDLIEVCSEGYFGTRSRWLEASGLIDTDQFETGERVYIGQCAGCHAIDGDGAGPAAYYLDPRPRNFRKGVFKFTATANGERPLRRDLFKTVTRGLAGSAMPDFVLLPERKRWAVVEYVRYLSLRGEFEQMMLDLAFDEEELPDPVEVRDIVESRWDEDVLRAVSPSTRRPEFDQASVDRGRELFSEPNRANCESCHGATGRGDGPSAGDFDDGWGYPIVPRDFTPGVFRAGETAEEIYVSIATGINGTPMPGFDGVLDAEEIWHLTHYCLHLAGRSPEGIQ